MMKIDYANNKFKFTELVECPRTMWNLIRVQLYRNVFYCPRCRNRAMLYYPQQLVSFTHRVLKAFPDLPGTVRYNQIICNECEIALHRALVPDHGYIYGCSTVRENDITIFEDWIKTRTEFTTPEEVVTEVE